MKEENKKECSQSPPNNTQVFVPDIPYRKAAFPHLPIQIPRHLFTLILDTFHGR